MQVLLEAKMPPQGGALGSPHTHPESCSQQDGYVQSPEYWVEGWEGARAYFSRLLADIRFFSSIVPIA